MMHRAATANHEAELMKALPINGTTPPEAGIDRMVYEFYGLTDDEIRVVEEAVR